MTDWARVLEEDLRWREAELSSLKRLAINSTDNDVTHKAMLRACWTILYAHFEGFTKYCWELLLDQVQERKIPVEELKEEFLLLAIEKEFRHLRGDMSAKSMWQFFNVDLPACLKSQAVFHDECRLDAQSNLWPNVFEEECGKVGIASVELDAHRSRIKALVARRNDIAHGQNMTIKSVGEYSDYEKAVLLVLHDLAVQVVEILNDDSYKAA